jgi:hypothetical protein
VILLWTIAAAGAVLLAGLCLLAAWGLCAIAVLDALTSDPEAEAFA